MKKLFIILLNPTITVKEVSSHECKLIWSSPNKRYHIRISDDGRLITSPNPKKIETDYSLFKKTFFIQPYLVHEKEGFNSLFISLSVDNYKFDSSFSLLYKEFHNKNEFSNNIISFNK